MECHDGIIVSFEGNCRVTWNVEKDIVQPITQHSSFPTSVGRVYSARMDYHPDYQFGISYCGGKMKLDIFKIGGRQCIENCSLIKIQSKTFDKNSSMKMMEISKSIIRSQYKQNYYFDGAQLIRTEDRRVHIFEFDV